MTSEDDIRMTLGFDVDEASVRRAKDAFESVKAGIAKTTDEANRAKKIEDLGKAFGLMAAEGKDASKSVDALAKSLVSMGASEKEIERATAAFRRQTEAINERRSGRSGGGDFDSAGAAGDIASGTAGVRGALDTFTGGNSGAAGQILEIGEALGDLGESIPRITASLDGLVSKGALTGGIFNKLSGVIGESGAKAAIAGVSFGVIGIALAALGAAVAAFQQQVAEAQKSITATFDSIREVQAFVREGGTTEDARAKIEELKGIIADEQEVLAKATQAQADAFRQVQQGIPIIGDIIARLADLFGVFGGLKDEVKKSTDTIKEAESDQSQYQKAIESGKTARNDAIKAEEEAAKTAIDTARAYEKSAAATTKSTNQQLSQEASAYQSQEQMLAQHLANEGSLKGQAYNQQIQMVQQAAASVQNGYRPLNMSGARGGTMSGFSFGGLRPIQNAPYVRRDGMGNARPSVGTLNINTSANPQDVIKVLNDVGLVGG